MSFSESCSADLLTVKCTEPLQNFNFLCYTQSVREVYFTVTIIERSLNLMLDGKENTHGITTSEKKTYTIDEIAALLNISMKSAYALVKSGQFHYIRAGRMIRVSKISFDKWLHE